MTGSLPHSGGEEGSLLHSGGRSQAEAGCFSRLPLLEGGFTLRGRWMSQLHRECRDRRNGSQVGFRLFFTTLERHQRAGHLLSRFPYPALLPSFSIAPGTNLGPPDQLVTLVLVGLIDLYERVRFAEQILGT